MQLHICDAYRRLDGNLAPSITGITCRAAIDLDKTGDTRLIIESPEEGARLIRAIADAVNLMTGAAVLFAEDPATAIAQDAVAIIAESIRTGKPVITADEGARP